MADGVSIFMPLYVGDYLSDTGDLSTEEHGAYLLLLLHMWRQDGALTNSHERLARIAGVPSERWGSVWSSIGRFFQVNDGTITNRRLTAELTRAKQRKEAAVAKAKAGAKAKWEHASSNASSNATGIAEALLEHCPSPSPSPSKTHTQKDPAPIAPEALALADRIRELALALYPNQPGLGDGAWATQRRRHAVEVARLQAGTGETWDDLRAGLMWAHQHVGNNGFSWGRQVRSGASFRKHWPSIAIEMRKPTVRNVTQSVGRPVGAAYQLGRDPS